MLSRKAIINISFILIILKLILSVSMLNEFESSLPKEIRLFYNIVDYLLIAALSIYVYNNFDYYIRYKSFFISSAIMMLLCFVNSLINTTNVLDNLSYFAKISFPLILFVVFINPKLSFTKLFRKRSIQLFLIIGFLSLFAILFFKAGQNRNESWLSFYFSGLHTQSYIILSVVFGLYIYFEEKKKRIFSIIVLVLGFLLLFYGYGVRTTSIALIIFILFRFIFDLKNKVNITILLGLMIPLIAIWFSSNFSADSLSQVSSGRTLMYLEKFKQIESATLVQFFFGQGYGSDLIETEVWWWEKKGAHNDYLTLLVENGLIFTGLFISIIINFINRIDSKYVKAMFVAYLFTSLVSNGFALRPLGAYVLMIIVVFIISIELISKMKINVKRNILIQNSKVVISN